MKFCDTLRLVKNEYRDGKMEWVVSVVLQILIFSCTFFVVSLVVDMDRMGEDYLHKLYPKGYEYSLSGYTEADREELEAMGFYDLDLGEDGGIGSTDTIRGIWIRKIKAAMDGKDIWNQDIDEFTVMLGLFQIIFGIIALLLILVMINNLSNSFSMKLLRRDNYIRMLFGLGAGKKEIRKIYYMFFSIRNLVSLLLAGVIDAGVVTVFNRHITGLLGIQTGMRIPGIFQGICLFLLIEWMMRMAFRRIWRTKR